MHLDNEFWSQRYLKGQTGWDAGGITRPLKEYFDQLEDHEVSILIPGCGNAYEAEYLYNNGFSNIYLADISHEPLQGFRKRVPSFPEDHLIHNDFFKLDGNWDLIVEQTFFSAIHPNLRVDYARKSRELLKPGGKLVGVLFDDPLYDDRPPFGGTKDDYLPVFKPYFKIKTFERCYNSIPPREGRELFINLVKGS